MAHGGRVITVVAEAAINPMAPVLSSSKPARFHLNFIIHSQKTLLDRQLKTNSLESTVCALYDRLKLVFFLVYLINWYLINFFWVLCIINWLHVKETDSVRKRLCSTSRNRMIFSHCRYLEISSFLHEIYNHIKKGSIIIE